MIKILLLGLGRWGVNHLRNLHSLPVELFIAEAGEKQLEPARKLGVPAHRLTTNYKNFAAEVDAAVIVTPAQTHFALCREFLEAGKDVFVEKPLTLASEEAKTLAELATRKGRILQVGHILRFDPATLWLRDAIRNGDFGRVNLLRGHFGGFKRPRNDSGVMFADGIHFVDLFNFVLGALPGMVMAIHHDFMGRGMEDVSFLSMEYDTPRGKTWATVENDYFIPGKFREVIVCGDKMSAVCDYNVAQYKIKTHANRHEAAGTDFKAIEGVVTQIETPPEEPLLAELRAFLDSIRTRQKPRADAWSGYDAVRVLNAAADSVKSGRAIALHPS
ncbi:MAG: Gfo/Idh/MocA family oxidoreductase [Verrucomicrobia bacterium]|nr:Gfo/Idh/MocA family oxidoreductase [Verrucomicrobiota bacterium]MDE3099983.1 Gfo/Idh/MocA family oxidoreductase [Verrucomicrobiota bacterium]